MKNVYSISLTHFRSFSRSHRRDKRCQTIPKWRLPGIFGLGYHANDWTSCELPSLRCVSSHETPFFVQGRPQFGRSKLDIVTALANQMDLDKEGVAIIMCESELESKYR